MNKRAYIFIVALVIIAGGISFYFATHKNTVPEVVTPNPEFDWRVIEGDVTLLSEGKEYPIGNYQGNCTIMASTSWKLLPGEISGVICYFAGGGQELAIFKEGGKYMLKDGVLEEPTDESQGLRGNFRTLRSIP